MKDFYPILEKCALFQGIDRTDLPGMLACLGARVTTVGRHQAIFSEGDEANFVGILLSGSDYVVGAQRYDESKTLLTVTEKGYGKRTELQEYLRTGPDGEKIPQGRGGKGLKNYNITEKTGCVAGCCIVGENDDVMVIENGGVIIRIPASTINLYKRDVQGVIVMRVEECNQVVSIEAVEHTLEEEA